MSIELRGLDEVIDGLDLLSNYDNVEAALEKACLIVERAARQKAPKGDGQLRNSIGHEVKNLEGAVYSNKEYAPYVEYGTGLFAENGGRTDVPWVYKDDKGEFHTTSGQNPQPFMRPALNENREKIIRILREGLLND